jgi:hypothetical protein
MFDKVQDHIKLCSAISCHKEVHAKGLCHNHYREQKRRASGSKPRAKRPDICAAYKCTRKHYSMNYCAAHYARFKNGGDIQEAKPVKILKYNQVGCQVSFCNKAHHAAGLCRTHDTTKRTYSLSTERLVDMLSKPCEVCGSSENLTIDHNHQCCNARFSCGKCVRGTLCQNCNRSIGQAKESPAILRLLAEYIDRYNKTLN